MDTKILLASLMVKYRLNHLADKTSDYNIIIVLHRFGRGSYHYLVSATDVFRDGFTRGLDNVDKLYMQMHNITRTLITQRWRGKSENGNLVNSFKK